MFLPILAIGSHLLLLLKPPQSQDALFDRLFVTRETFENFGNLASGPRPLNVRAMARTEIVLNHISDKNTRRENLASPDGLPRDRGIHRKGESEREERKPTKTTNRRTDALYITNAAFPIRKASLQPGMVGIKSPEEISGYDFFVRTRTFWTIA